jgi:hypothetical protein
MTGPSGELPRPEDVAEALRAGVPPSTLLDADPASEPSDDADPGDVPGSDPSSARPDPGPTTGTA